MTAGFWGSLLVYVLQVFALDQLLVRYFCIYSSLVGEQKENGKTLPRFLISSEPRMIAKFPINLLFFTYTYRKQKSEEGRPLQTFPTDYVFKARKLTDAYAHVKLGETVLYKLTYPPIEEGGSS